MLEKEVHQCIFSDLERLALKFFLGIPYTSNFKEGNKCMCVCLRLQWHYRQY